MNLAHTSLSRVKHFPLVAWKIFSLHTKFNPEKLLSFWNGKFPIGNYAVCDCRGINSAVAVSADPEADFKSQCPLKNEEIS